MADSQQPDVSDAAPPVYKHTLSGHAVQGDATFKEINDHDRPYEGGSEGAMNLPDINVFAEAAGMKEKEKEDTTPLEPLPEIPGMPMTVEQAYDCASPSLYFSFCRRSGAAALSLPHSCLTLHNLSLVRAHTHSPRREEGGPRQPRQGQDALP